MRFNIYHTNDIHSNYEFLKRVHRYIKDNKTEDDLYFDSGDYLDLSSIIVEADGGKNAMDMLMDLDLEMITLGNNEMDLGVERLEKLLSYGYPMLSSNVKHLDKSDIDGLYKSKIIEKHGKRFLILGVTPHFSNDLSYSSYNKFFELGELTTINPLDSLKEEFEKNEGQYDFVIFLSHSGHVVDPYLIKNLPKIDLILGAHTHLIVSEGNYSMSGKGERIGKITIEIKDDEIEIVENIQIDPDDLENEDFDKLIKDKYEKSYLLLSEEIDIVGDLDFDPINENRLINFLCDAFYKHYECDFAFINNGIAIDSIQKPVTKQKVIETFPSKLNPTIFEIYGSQLIEAMKNSQSLEFIRQSGRAPGHRGYILGSLSFSHNIKIKNNPLQILIDGKEIEADKKYKVVSSDYLQRGSCYTSLNTEDSTFDKMFIKEFIQLYLKDKEVYRNSEINRYL